MFGAPGNASPKGALREADANAFPALPGMQASSKQVESSFPSLPVSPSAGWFSMRSVAIPIATR